MRAKFSIFYFQNIDFFLHLLIFPLKVRYFQNIDYILVPTLRKKVTDLQKKKVTDLQKEKKLKFLDRGNIHVVPRSSLCKHCNFPSRLPPENFPKFSCFSTSPPPLSLPQALPLIIIEIEIKIPPLQHHLPLSPVKLTVY